MPVFNEQGLVPLKPSQPLGSLVPVSSGEFEEEEKADSEATLEEVEASSYAPSLMMTMPASPQSGSRHALPGSPPSPPGPAAEELALLAFKSMLLSDGGSPVLASWNTSSHFCRWPGVACSREKVVALRLGSSNLSGRISP